MIRGIAPIVPVASKTVAITPSGNSDYDTLPSYLHFIKAVQNGNNETAQMALNHAVQIHGPQMGSDLSLLGKNMQSSNINDIAKRSVSNERNPQLKKLYAMINENPDILNKFDYSMQNQGMSGSLAGK